MQRGPEVEERGAGKLLPFSSKGVRWRPRVWLGHADELTPVGRLEHSALRANFNSQRGRSVQDLLAVAAGLAIWGLLWLVIAFAVISPLGSMLSQQAQARPAPAAMTTESERRGPYPRQELAGRVRPVSSSPLADPAASCQRGFVAVDDRCELGEEIEIRPPAGWQRR